MKYRTAIISDAGEIAKLHTKSWRNTYGNALGLNYLTYTVPSERKSAWVQRLTKPKRNQRVLIAEQDHELVGFVCIYIDEHIKLGSYLDNLHVYQSNQGKGIGKKLLLKAIEMCNQQANSKSLYLLVNQDNLHAQKFYEKNGAINLEEGVWNAPDGSIVPTYILYWNFT